MSHATGDIHMYMYMYALSQVVECGTQGVFRGYIRLCKKANTRTTTAVFSEVQTAQMMSGVSWTKRSRVRRRSKRRSRKVEEEVKQCCSSIRYM